MNAQPTFDTHNPTGPLDRPLGGPLRWAALVVLCAVAMLARRPSIIRAPTLWLEDAGVFLRGARVDGVSALTHAYNGYFHTVPRLIALVVNWFPVSWTPTLYALLSAFVAAGCCALVMSQRLGWLFRSRVRQWVTLALLVALPRIGEIQATLTNTIWWLGLALLLTILCDDPTTAVGRRSEVALVVLFVLSGANGVLLAPFMLVRVGRLRSSHSWRLLTSWWLAAGIQVVALATGTRPDPGAVPSSVASLGRWAVERTVGPLVIGGNWVEERQHLVTDYRLRYTALVIIAAIGITVVILAGHRWTTSVMALGVPIVGVAAGLVATGGFARWLPGRYTAIPIAALLIGLISAHPPQRLVRCAQYALLVWIIAIRPVDLVIPARPAIAWEPVATCLERNLEVCAVPSNPDPSAPPALIPASR